MSASSPVKFLVSLTTVGHSPALSTLALPPGPANRAHRGEDTNSEVWPPRPALLRGRARVVIVISAQLGPQHQHRAPVRLRPAGVGGADEEEDCAVKCLADLIIWSVNLQEELAWLLTVRTLHLRHGGKILQVQPGWSASNLRGEISTLNLPGFVVGFHETKIYISRHL